MIGVQPLCTVCFFFLIQDILMPYLKARYDYDPVYANKSIHFILVFLDNHNINSKVGVTLSLG